MLDFLTLGCEKIETCGHGLVVEHVLAKDGMGVRFSLAAPIKRSFWGELKTLNISHGVYEYDVKGVLIL